MKNTESMPKRIDLTSESIQLLAVSELDIPLFAFVDSDNKLFIQSLSEPSKILNAKNTFLTDETITFIDI
jgi:hypothetical protein